VCMIFLAAKPDKNLDELANALKLSRQPARILMVGLTSLGIVIRNPEGRFRNAALTEARLVKGRPGYAAPILGWQRISFIQACRILSRP